jgi:hypothetical protein
MFMDATFKALARRQIALFPNYIETLKYLYIPRKC